MIKTDLLVRLRQFGLWKRGEESSTENAATSGGAGVPRSRAICPDRRVRFRGLYGPSHVGGF